jgi:hypothetical protein
MNGNFIDFLDIKICSLDNLLGKIKASYENMKNKRIFKLRTLYYEVLKLLLTLFFL